MKPINIAILGALGRMGRILSQQISDDDRFALVARIDRPDTDDDQSNPRFPPLIHDLADAPSFDILIDFSNPAATQNALPQMKLRHAAWLVATTGISDDLRLQIEALAASQPIFIAANTSLGIALMQRLCAKAASILADWDCEIVETHHRCKLDAPSGTALALANAIANARGRDTSFVTSRNDPRQIRPQDEIGISSLRGGSVAGEHQAIWFGPYERFEIRHCAENREIFAHGARRIACWLSKQTPGLYNMSQLIDEILN